MVLKLDNPIIRLIGPISVDRGRKLACLTLKIWGNLNFKKIRYVILTLNVVKGKNLCSDPYSDPEHYQRKKTEREHYLDPSLTLWMTLGGYGEKWLIPLKSRRAGCAYPTLSKEEKKRNILSDSSVAFRGLPCLTTT